MPSNNMNSFRQLFQQSHHVVFLTGAGVSAESGVPTFRGAGGYWRTYRATDLATPSAFRSNPSLVWEFYHYRRENMLSKEPNDVRILSRQSSRWFDSLVRFLAGPQSHRRMRTPVEAGGQAGGRHYAEHWRVAPEGRLGGRDRTSRKSVPNALLEVQVGASQPRQSDMRSAER